MSDVKPEKGMCNLCGGEDCKILYNIQRFKQKFTMVRCRDCGLIYMNPRPLPEELFQYYSAEYYSGDANYSYADERKNEKANTIIYNKRLSIVESFLNGGGNGWKILDIGCSFGGLLVAARDREWETYGVEVSKHSADHAINENGLDIQVSTLESADLPKNFYDAVNMVEVIEHLTDPLGSMMKIRESLKPGGILLVQTANADSLKARLSRSRWEYFLPGHLYCFSRKTLSALLNKAGFKIERIYYGDELGAKAKLKSLMLSDSSNIKKAVSVPVKIGKHYLRKVRIGNISIGGNVFIAKKLT
jgi:2-polyprenyl-3-methyl-5-hydroxy-6-metoxy-1,4-benzoquinol methylase